MNVLEDKDQIGIFCVCPLQHQRSWDTVSSISEFEGCHLYAGKITFYHFIISFVCVCKNVKHGYRYERSGAESVRHKYSYLLN